MKLAQYLAAERGRCARLARTIGIAPAYLWQMAHGRRPVPPDVAPSIEAASNHAVRRWDLRPEDWHRIWPDLQPQPACGHVANDSRNLTHADAAECLGLS